MQNAPSNSWLQLLLLGMAASLSACGTLGNRGEGGEKAEAQAEGAAPLSFQVQITSPNRDIASHLRQHMDIQRFKGFPDLQAGELRRLLSEAEANARDLLAALGYFKPQLKLQMEAASQDANAPRRILIDVDSGEQAKVSRYDIQFAESVAVDPEVQSQREAIRRSWMLREGRPFTQEAWDEAKSGGLRALQRERFPVARIAESQARVNADSQRADLHITYDAGPRYRFGELSLKGVERYDAEGIGHIARIPVGRDYSEAALLDAQQRLVNSGYFDSAFLMLDPDEADPAHATVVAELREAKYQKVVFGLGFSTDTGPRLSADHTHNEMWPLGWRAFNQVALGTSTQSLATRWTAMPRASGWASYAGAAIERSDYGDFRARSVSLTGGRMKSTEHTDRRYFLQYDLGTTEGNEAPGGSSSMLANYAWTGRYFDDKASPTAGFGLGAEAGIGFTLSPNQDPFLRFSARALKFWPFGGSNEAGKRNRLALRADLGAVYAGADVNIPVRLLFLTGGDTTVRGYGYQSIGTRLDDGSIYGARYMASGSVEWQRPMTVLGNAANFEHTTFVDVGTATDRLSQYTLFTGVGTGMRWQSPVGPLQLDVAYGLQDRQVRFHLRMGFQF